MADRVASVDVANHELNDSIAIPRSGTVTTMTLSTRLAILVGLMFSVGWILVLASGYGGDSTGGSELVWRIGGIMVYAPCRWD